MNQPTFVPRCPLQPSHGRRSPLRTRQITHPIQSLPLSPCLAVGPSSAILFLMYLCHHVQNQRRERGSHRQSPACKNATTKRTQASRLPQIAKRHIYKADPCASGSHTAPTTHPRPEKRTHRLGSNRIPIPTRTTRRKRVIQLQYLHNSSSSINYIQQSIVTPPRSVLIIEPGLRRLSRVQFRQRNKPKF